MPGSIPTEVEKRVAREKATREFPGNPSLQEIHYIRCLFEIEWRTMTTEEILEKVKLAKKELMIS